MGQVQVPDPNHDCTAWLASSPPACIPPAYPWPSAITSCWSKIEPSLETGRGFCAIVATPERSDAGRERARHGHFGIITRMGLCAQSLQVPVEDSSFKGKRKKGRSTAEIKKGQIDTLAPNATRPFLPIPDHDPARAFFPPPPRPTSCKEGAEGTGHDRDDVPFTSTVAATSLQRTWFLSGEVSWSSSPPASSPRRGSFGQPGPRLTGPS